MPPSLHLQTMVLDLIATARFPRACNDHKVFLCEYILLKLKHFAILVTSTYPLEFRTLYSPSVLTQRQLGLLLIDIELDICSIVKLFYLFLPSKAFSKSSADQVVGAALNGAANLIPSRRAIL